MDPNNTIATGGFAAAWIETGVVSDVNLNEYTCTVDTDSGKHLPGMQAMSPYLHTHSGEGASFVPEVDAICVVCFPSDNGAPFILGYLSGVEADGVAPSKELANSVGQVGNETEEASSTSSTGAYQAPKTRATFRGGRRRMTPGSILLMGRDGNRMVLHRGGIVEIGSTAMAQRFYIPVGNVIKDVAENYHAMTPGGQLSWTVDREEADPGGSAAAEWRLCLRDKVSDKKAAVQVRLGHASSSDRVEVLVAPNGVDVGTGEVSVTPVYKMIVDSSGNRSTTMSGSLSYTIKAGRDVTILGTDSLSVQGNRTVSVTGTESVSITGAHSVKGAGVSTEVWTGAKTIQAPVVLLGPAPAEPVPLGGALVEWLTKHLTTGHASIPPPQKAAMLAELARIVSATVKVSK